MPTHCPLSLFLNRSIILRVRVRVRVRLLTRNVKICVKNMRKKYA